MLWDLVNRHYQTALVWVVILASFLLVGMRDHLFNKRLASGPGFEPGTDIAIDPTQATELSSPFGH